MLIKLNVSIYMYSLAIIVDSIALDCKTVFKKPYHNMNIWEYLCNPYFGSFPPDQKS